MAKKENMKKEITNVLNKLNIPKSKLPKDPTKNTQTKGFSLNVLSDRPKIEYILKFYRLEEEKVKKIKNTLRNKGFKVDVLGNKTLTITTN